MNKYNLISTISAFRRRLLIMVPFLWFLLFFALPFAIVLKISFSYAEISIPPYSELISYFDETLNIKLNLGNYLFLLEDAIYLDAYLNSLKMAFIATIICLLIGYPMAYAMARFPRKQQIFLLVLVLMPSWTSFLIRIYAWVGILQQDGLLNQLLMAIGFIDQPLKILNTDAAVYIGIVYAYLPFMILPIYANLTRLDNTLIEAAQDLGSGPFDTFLKVTLPLSKNGVIAGSMLVCIPIIGEVVVPQLLGATDTLMIGNILWQEFFNNRDWPVASALATVNADYFTVAHCNILSLSEFGNGEVPMNAAAFRRLSVSKTILFVGMLFLYLPMLVLMVYSFNESKMVTVWSGFSGKWYLAMFQDEQLMNAVWISIKIAFYAATTAVILGGIAAYCLYRYQRFRGRSLLSNMLAAPLVMPDVMIGLSLLLLFVGFSQFFTLFENRGMFTVWIAHVTLCTAYVTVVVSSRLRDMDPALEEAAHDLGASSFHTFFLVILPIILPSLLVGWLLSFTLSLDDVVIASFVSGPSSTTLPMVVFSSVRLGVSPKVNALATLIILIVSIVSLISWWWLSQAEARQRKRRSSSEIL